MASEAFVVMDFEALIEYETGMTRLAHITKPLSGYLLRCKDYIVADIVNPPDHIHRLPLGVSQSLDQIPKVDQEKLKEWCAKRYRLRLALANKSSKDPFWCFTSLQPVIAKPPAKLQTKSAVADQEVTIEDITILNDRFTKVDLTDLQK